MKSGKNRFAQYYVKVYWYEAVVCSEGVVLKFRTVTDVT